MVQGDRLGLFTRPSLMVIAWFKRMIRSRLNLRTFLPDVNKNLDPKRVTDKGRFFLTDSFEKRRCGGRSCLPDQQRGSEA